MEKERVRRDYTNDWTLRCSFESERPWVNDRALVAYEAIRRVGARARFCVLELKETSHACQR